MTSLVAPRLGSPASSRGLAATVVMSHAAQAGTDMAQLAHVYIAH